MKKMNSIGIVSSLLSGILFGAGMIISGMADPQNVIGFLDITGDWNPSLAFVMGGALVVFIPFYHFLIKPRANAVNGETIAQPKTQTVDKRLIVGSAVFGIGWGIAGICPGPAISSIGSGSHVIVMFTLAMLVGMLVARGLITKLDSEPSVFYQAQKSS